MGFPVKGPAHSMCNPFDEDLVYLFGVRDVCDYPYTWSGVISRLLIQRLETATI